LSLFLSQPTTASIMPSAATAINLRITRLLPPLATLVRKAAARRPICV
jgi:hypothetical protein